MTLCPACGGSLAPWRQVPASDPILNDAPYELLRCSSCGTAVTAGAEPPRLYESGAYGTGAPRLRTVAAPILRAFDRQRLAMLRDQAPAPARLLDVGAGRGRFVVSARRAGYDAHGLEPAASRAHAAAATGALVQHASVDSAEIATGSYDVATLWHVLEHLDDPRAALTRVGGWLRPGGALLVGVPNLDSLQARIGGERWYHLDVPRHRVHFTPSGIDRLLLRAGFAPLRTHHLLLEHNPFGMWQSLMNRLTKQPSFLFNMLKRNAPVASPDLAITLAGLPLAPLAALVEAGAAALGRGGTIAVLATRDGYH